MHKACLLLLLLLPLTSKAQNSKWLVYPSLGLETGGAVPIPLSAIPDGSKLSPRLNLSFGVGVEHQYAGNWNVGFELSYHQLGFEAIADVWSQPFYTDNHQDVLYFSGHTKTNAEFRMLELPVIAIYKFGRTSSGLIGMYYSRILDGTFHTKGSKGVLSDDKSITDNAQLPGPASTNFSFDDYLDSWDIGMLLGYRHSLSHRLFLWGNLKVGFNSIFKNSFNNVDYEMYQVRLNVGTSVYLFQKPASSYL